MTTFGFLCLFGKNFSCWRLKKSFLTFLLLLLEFVLTRRSLFLYTGELTHFFFSPEGKLTIPYTICWKGYLFLTILKYHVCRMLSCHISAATSGFSILVHWSLWEPVLVPPCFDYYSFNVSSWYLVRQIPPYYYSFSILEGTVLPDDCQTQ